MEVLQSGHPLKRCECVLPTPCWFMGVIFEGAAGGKQAPEPVSTSLMS
jgi:hypothetical protein